MWTKKRRKVVYIFWVIAATLTILSMIAFLLAPAFLYGGY